MSADPFDHATVMGEVSAILDDLGGPTQEEEAHLLRDIISVCARKLARGGGMAASRSDWLFAHVIDAMQEAEERGGPEGDAYDATMGAIIDECAERISNHNAWWPGDEGDA